MDSIVDSALLVVRRTLSNVWLALAASHSYLETPLGDFFDGGTSVRLALEEGAGNAVR